MSLRHLKKVLCGCAVPKAEVFLQDVEQEPPAVQRAADKANTASPRAQSAAKPTKKDSPADASQRTKPPTSVGKASEWKTRSRPKDEPNGKKAVVDTPAAAAAANDSAVRGLAARVAGADALAMMPPIPGPPLTQGTPSKAAASRDPSGSKHGKQKGGSDTMLAQAGGGSQKAGAGLDSKAPAKPVTSEAEGTIHWLRRPNCNLSPVCSAHLQSSRIHENTLSLVAFLVKLLALCNYFRRRQCQWGLTVA